ncbi:DUF4406 domain-containing protein [Flavobacteriaceae bacterium]|nr:DUF4406 domain-containing protein [Flavobacteriaceae bacterium]MDC1285231.1 DUF4406 domain-containing protein [Flavobacteriaceae bacterium]
MKTTIYIAGKVSGEKLAQCTMKFGLAQKSLQDKGYTVVNPLEVINDWKMPWDKAMEVCIEALSKCDAIYMLNDWKTSKGAKIEHEYAQQNNIEIQYQ